MGMTEFCKKISKFIARLLANEGADFIEICAAIGWSL